MADNNSNMLHPIICQINPSVEIMDSVKCNARVWCDSTQKWSFDPSMQGRGLSFTVTTEAIILFVTEKMENNLLVSRSYRDPEMVQGRCKAQSFVMAWSYDKVAAWTCDFTTTEGGARVRDFDFAFKVYEKPQLVGFISRNGEPQILTPDRIPAHWEGFRKLYKKINGCLRKEGAHMWLLATGVRPPFVASPFLLRYKDIPNRVWENVEVVAVRKFKVLS